MTTYSELMAGLNFGHEGRTEATIPESWMQGRTTYGGLTAALCLEAATKIVPDIPVRTAQVAFIGPVGGEIVVSPKILRRGKNTVVVNVDLVTEAGLGARCLFVFGAARESSLQLSNLPITDSADLEAAPVLPPNSLTPAFIKNFIVKFGEGGVPMSGAETGSVGLWLSHTDAKAPKTASTVLSLADVPWPAALPMLKTPAPGSSMTWMAEFVSEDYSNLSTWTYALSVAETAMNGYSSQAMTLWDETGKPLLVGRQTVTIFG